MKREATLFKKQALPEGQSGLVDNPAENDLLDFMQFAQPIANRIISTIKDKSTPMTIGIYGEWGSGKSTFLKLVDHQGLRPRVVCTDLEWDGGCFPP